MSEVPVQLPRVGGDYTVLAMVQNAGDMCRFGVVKYKFRLPGPLRV